MKEIILKTKKRVFSNELGRRSSKFKGEGLNFKELREYVYGEDAKKIDWKISAKLQKPVIKEFEDERNLNVIVLVLASGTLHFGIEKLKSELISEIVALLGFSAIKYDDKFSLIIYDKNLHYFKPTKSIKKIPFFVEKVYSFEFLKKDYDEKFIQYLNRIKKSLLFVISDFYHHPKLHLLKHETIALIIRDKFEEYPKELGEIDIINPVTFKRSLAYFSKENAKKINDKILTQDRKFFEYLRKYQIPFTKIYTNEDIFFKLKELMR